MDAYRNINGIIERKVHDTGSTLFSEWDGEPSRFFYLPGDPPWQCFQVTIFPPQQGVVVVQAASIDANDEAEMLDTWQGRRATWTRYWIQPLPGLRRGSAMFRV